MSNLTILQNGRTVVRTFTPPMPLSALVPEDSTAFPCSQKGICGACRVTAVGALSVPDTVETEKLSPSQLQNGTRLLCRVTVLGDAKVTLPSTTSDFENAETASASSDNRCGFAIDIGTTNVVVSLYDLTDGHRCGSLSFRNPQARYGADVLSRAMGDVSALQGLIRSALSAQCLALLSACGKSAEDVHCAVVVGNTVMLYLLTGHNPSSLTVAPFSCETKFGEWIPSFLPMREGSRIYIPRCISAFLGADCSAAALASSVQKDGTRLLCDLGTNGEILLQKDGRLYGCSCAAGPAFEAVGMACSMPFGDGAIEHILLSGGQLIPIVHGQGEAKGLCGASLMDLLACLSTLGILAADGTLAEERFTIPNTSVFITQKDVRAFQLAKAAVRAGMECLLRETDTSRVDTLELAGAFGSALHMRSVKAIGLIPSCVQNTVSIGNAAEQGAAMMLLNRSKIDECTALAQSTQTLATAMLPDFNDTLLSCLFF